ncbi:glucokinase [Spongiibacter sp.]|uniref:glucokinase n=1 Tax=Spongiibacter sp. TaxID=2024860 RepID=UPI003566C4DF
MSQNNQQVLQVVADIGGTNARFAYIQPGQTTLQGIEVFPCSQFPQFIDAVRAYTALGHVANIESLCFAVAGPVEQDWIDLPNNHWAFSRCELERELGVPVIVINDFSAQVLSVSALLDDELHWIGGPRPEAEPNGVVAVLGPGTGLGVSAMLPSGDIIPSEGGHIGFAPTNQHQANVLAQLWRRYERVSVERVLSGAGLANLYWANCRLDGLEKELAAPDVTAGARAGDVYCRRAVDDFCAILGAVAGDTALAVGAYAGVYLSGGILPQMLDVIDTEQIRRNFQEKGRFSAICSQIPLAIVLAEYPGLVGCARQQAISHAHE